MNTPAHLVLGAAIFARPARTGFLWAALLGGLAPDLSLYLMAGVSLIVLQIPPQVVFDELYFSAAWQTVFAIDNSVFVWSACWRWGSGGAGLCCRSSRRRRFCTSRWISRSTTTTAARISGR